MKKIQCTFRLPENVVDLIDKQNGETRTDKLLSLLGFENKQGDYSEMQSVISSEFEIRFQLLESRISKLELSNKKPGFSLRTSSNSANENRKVEAIKKLNAELDTIPKSDYELICDARYPLAEIRKRTNISKSQCDLYKDIINKHFGL